LYALSLGENYGPEPWFVKSGSDMEARLWTDIAAYYHVGLKNVSAHSIAPMEGHGNLT